jgi:hypothetical protein
MVPEELTRRQRYRRSRGHGDSSCPGPGRDQRRLPSAFAGQVHGGNGVGQTGDSSQDESPYNDLGNAEVMPEV